MYKIQDFMAVNDPGTHLSPPFYNASDDSYRVQSLREPDYRQRSATDVGNYGKGGYYGNTYRHELDTAEGWQGRKVRRGHGDTYRHLGDRRYHDDPDQTWETESRVRHGYRSIEQRIRTQEDHRGKGPRSYQRGDGRILEDVNDRLYDDPFLDASAIEVAVIDGEVTLQGTVPDRQSKRRAEDIAETVRGVKNVENRLRLTPISM